MQIKNSKLPANVLITSFLLALFANTKFVNLIVLAAFPSLSGVFMAAMYGAMVPLLFIVGIFVQKHSLNEMSRSHIAIAITCLFWYVATSVLIGPPSVSFAFFGVFTLAAFLIPGFVRIDVRTVLLSLIITSSVGIFYVNQIIISSIMEEGTLSMGICYSMLVPVIANLVYIRYFFMQEKKLMKIALLPITAINIFYLVQMTMFGSRGPVLCALLLIASLFLIFVEDSTIRIRKGRVLIIAVCVVIVALSFTQILQVISNYLAQFDISLNVIDKFLRLDNAGDMTNGRDDIDKVAWEGIWNSPIIGHGTSQFDKYTGLGYPHNFILQMLYDGGIVLASIVFIPIARSLLQKKRLISEEEFILLLCLFFASVPGALFSGDLWNSIVLWMFFGFVVAKESVYINNKNTLL